MRDALFKFHLGRKKYWFVGNEKSHFIHSGADVGNTAKGGRKWKKRRKGQFQQSYVLASSAHKSTPKPADIQIIVETYEGEDLQYNRAWKKVPEVNHIQMKVSVKSFKLLIPFLEEGQDMNPGSTVTGR